MTRKRRRHTPDQIIRKLAEGHKQLAGGQSLEEVCRPSEIAESTWHRWLAQYGGMQANDAKRLRELEGENARLKKLLAEAGLDKSMLKEIAKGELCTHVAPASFPVPLLAASAHARNQRDESSGESPDIPLVGKKPCLAHMTYTNTMAAVIATNRPSARRTTTASLPGGSRSLHVYRRSLALSNHLDCPLVKFKGIGYR